MKVYDRGEYKDAKYCEHCGKIFTIRKKWKDCFDEVRFCSQKCKSEFKKKV